MNTRRLLITVVVALGGSLVMNITGTPALAAGRYVFSGEFGSAGSSSGQFSKPAGIAVDAETGDVYVADTGNNRVQKFDSEGKYLSELNASETPAGSFAGPLEIAVDNSGQLSKGDVYVADTNNDVVDKFDNSGKYISQIVGMPAESGVGLEPFSVMDGVAVDAAGNVWVYEQNKYIAEFTGGASNDYLRRLHFTRFPEPGIAVDSLGYIYIVRRTIREIDEFAGGSGGSFGEELGTFDPGPAFGVSVDQSDNVYVDHGSVIIKYDSSKTVLQEIGRGHLVASEGIGVGPSAAYASDSQENKVDIFEMQILPDTVTSAASGLTSTAVTLKGTLNPDGVALTSCEFQYFDAAEASEYDHSASCSSMPSATSGLNEVNARVTGVKPNDHYVYRLVASNANGTEYGREKTVRIPSPPSVGGWVVGNLAPGTATVSAIVESGGLATDYEIDFGTDANYGSHTLGEVVGVSQTVSMALIYLKPGMTYHYRIVASNQDGTASSGDQTFTTPLYQLALPPVLPQIAVPAIAFPAHPHGRSVKSRHKPTKHHKAKKRHKKKKK